MLQANKILLVDCRRSSVDCRRSSVDCRRSESIRLSRIKIKIKVPQKINGIADFWQTLWYFLFVFKSEGHSPGGGGGGGGGVLHPNWGTMLSTSSRFGPYGI